MKRREFERYLREQGCFLLREGGRHSVWHNPSTGLTSTVPRHANIDDPALVRKICRDLGITAPRKKLSRAPPKPPISHSPMNRARKTASHGRTDMPLYCTAVQYRDTCALTFQQFSKMKSGTSVSPRPRITQRFWIHVSFPAQSGN